MRVLSHNGATKKVKIEGPLCYPMVVDASKFSDPTSETTQLKMTTHRSILVSTSVLRQTTLVPHYAKWISRLFVFENACDGLEVKLTSIFYNTDDIKVYFRPRTIGLMVTWLM